MESSGISRLYLFFPPSVCITILLLVFRHLSPLLAYSTHRLFTCITYVYMLTRSHAHAYTHNNSENVLLYLSLPTCSPAPQIRQSADSTLVILRNKSPVGQTLDSHANQVLLLGFASFFFVFFSFLFFDFSPNVSWWKLDRSGRKGRGERVCRQISVLPSSVERKLCSNATQGTWRCRRRTIQRTQTNKDSM